MEMVMTMMMVVVMMQGKGFKFRGKASVRLEVMDDAGIQGTN